MRLAFGTDFGMSDSPHGTGDMAVSSAGLGTRDTRTCEPDRDWISDLLFHQNVEAGAAQSWDGSMPCFRNIALHGMSDDYGIKRWMAGKSQPAG